MAEPPLVRFGNADKPVTERFEPDLDELKRPTGSRQLHYPGVELLPIGETSRAPEFADPEHVVANRDVSDAGRPGLDDPGFYVAEGLSRFAVKKLDGGD